MRVRSVSHLNLSCVLFDLDGTLVDTAPDLLAALNYALQQHGYAVIDTQAIKPFISFGAAAMIKKSLGDNGNEIDHAPMLATMLSHYQQHLACHSRLFDGMAELLADIEEQGIKWGVVTNKHRCYTQPLMSALGLTQRAACIVSGDDTPFPKPNPAPLFAACQQAGVSASECVYIGDASHDITAGNSANMTTLAAVYGYLKPNDTPELWGAELLIHSPTHLADWLKEILCR